ncbi:Transcription activator of gluconeogenesis acuK [Taphrina deformans PYCC 5710]|uniref:Transcription activator of gluconeogenesis acuK n=1 Tax=Taphrina deformans (strain PYCC 5710 / ATCC 11124 / CBS 356.35 / IMI 108563 / JCM 9778 / NBRC 8474) TaxID=1097556 RepID=R4XI58_TAPDE|nr:Transcription activator of gluconeogenesis acuK [Taphrina deformans PYCC 5710]|eukprot:CCG83077.1 Transcription activator of gluconeogenesis acuK [Taphrina deformans PYCC 5710]
MEYSMLSNMLGNATTPGTDYGHSPDTTSFTSPGMNNIQRTLPSRQHTITPDQASVASESSWTQIPIGGSSGGGSTLKHSLPQSQSSMAYTNSSQTPNSNVQVVDSSNTPKSPMLQTPAAAMTQSGRHGNQYVDPHGQRPTPVARRPHSGSRDGRGSIYKAIIKPFSYTNGYHLLNTYLRSRFEKEDLLRIARAIVGYRPSFIALTKTLKEEDLIFMEVCFQRTLLEYEKFVGYSGTPTIIWRRTGQIELVGKEFCLLTQWSREQLLSKQTFIVELMDDSSVVEYFEKFSAHAFGDTSSVQTTCVLMTPQKRAVPCAFCFTIKRDVFDIPMMIVGNFLPVL